MSSETPVSLGSSEVKTDNSSVKPVKEKKPPTDKQVAQRQVALSKMMEKRKQLNEERKEKKEKVKVAKKIVEEKILKDDLKIPSYNDIDSLRKELAELRGMVSMKQQMEKEKPVAVKPTERIVERVIERPAVSSTPTASKLTGHALLDKLFFDK